jgi:hypothetical protein
MGSITIKSGTPRASDALCRRCTHSHILKGFSVTEEIFFCEQFYPTRPVPFLICECTLYEDKRRATLKSMELIAWYLTTKKPGRSVGFVSAARFHEIQEEPKRPHSFSSKGGAKIV